MLCPGLVNGPWSQAEDSLLTQLYTQYGPKWSFIAKQFQGRSDANVKNRWVRHLMTMQGSPQVREPDVDLPFDEVWGTEFSFDW
jgi:hypothetical protein